MPACAERENSMNNRPKGNHKHLNHSDRIVIERGLANNESFRTIAAKIEKDPSTISKEVRLHSYYVERPQNTFAPIPCVHNYNPSNPKANICKMKHGCGDNDCEHNCVVCRKDKCANICEYYEPRTCEKLLKPPYICNSCSKYVNCLMQRKKYSAKYAQDSYELTLCESREGINQTPEKIQKMDEILTPLLLKGQSIAHIYATHADELACSRRTIYTYIDKCVFGVRNIDLRRKVKYKPRRKSTAASLKDRSFRKNRTYKDFQKYIEKNPAVSIVEMDTVEGRKGTPECFLTMLFRSCNLMLIFLLQTQTQEEVSRVFDHLTKVLGIELFQAVFKVILTDNGHEFQNPEELEHDENGEMRTTIFYCDPNRSDQKGALEKNHEYIRYVLPKGVPLTQMTKLKTQLLMNHINSEKRDSLNGHSPYEVSRLLINNKLHSALGLIEIPADEVTLTPSLIK